MAGLPSLGNDSPELLSFDSIVVSFWGVLFHVFTSHRSPVSHASRHVYVSVCVCLCACRGSASLGIDKVGFRCTRSGGFPFHFRSGVSSFFIVERR